MNLFEVNENIDRLLQMMDEAQTEEEAQLYRDTIESLEFDLEDQLENMVKSIKNLEADRKAYREQIDFFQDKDASVQKKIDRRKQLIKSVMEHREKQKVKAGVFDLRIQTNGGKRGIIYFVEPEHLPEKLSSSRVVITPSEDNIRALLDSGATEYDGVPIERYFKYKEKGTHLRIS